MPVPGPKRRFALSAVLALVLPLLGLSGASATDVPAIPETELSGFAEIRDPYVYVSTLEPNELINAGRVIHVDTEHADDTGFWYARETLRPQHDYKPRDFQWFYQTWGTTCATPNNFPLFSPWMNTWQCMNAPEHVATFEGADSARLACASRVAAEPWLLLELRTIDGRLQANCSGRNSLSAHTSMNHGLVPATAAEVMECAPWEAVGCRDKQYAWSKVKKDVVAELWRPAPDTCTGLPADANRHKSTVANLEAPADPACTGEELASNCPVGSVHAACTVNGAREQGSENPAYGWVIAEKLIYATDEVTKTATASSTQTRTRSGKSVKVTLHGKWRGHKVKRTQKGASKIVETAKVTVTRSVTQDTKMSAWVVGVGQSAAQAAAHAKKIGVPTALHLVTASFANLHQQAYDQSRAIAARDAQNEAIGAAETATYRSANAAEIAAATVDTRAKAVPLFKGDIASLEKTYQKAKKLKAKYVAAKKKYAKAKTVKKKRTTKKKRDVAKRDYQTASKEHASFLRSMKA
ncbi:hypothetical protein [Nocardioides yefusunii]|uniref:Uncharacterized protein n=1 Tax=Nocardioides yefusunii TaxID=2500546 RepID=A0ABW1QUX8_9ACTN|nr:hypothetical protein [Nocardioides yefusunii]